MTKLEELKKAMDDAGAADVDAEVAYAVAYDVWDVAAAVRTAVKGVYMAARKAYVTALKEVKND
jgi:hypothetical protein